MVPLTVQVGSYSSAVTSVPAFDAVTIIGANILFPMTVDMVTAWLQHPITKMNRLVGVFINCHTAQRKKSSDNDSRDLHVVVVRVHFLFESLVPFSFHA